MTDTRDEEPIDVLPSRKLSAEEAFYHEAAYKEPVQSVERVEDTAKFLAGAVATTSGLFVSALKLSATTATALRALWLVPFVFWWLSLLSLLVVIMPQHYRVGHNEPASWRKRFVEVRERKYRWLVVGGLFFILGIAAALLPLIDW